jgi:hypothetical protein
MGTLSPAIYQRLPTTSDSLLYHTAPRFTTSSHPSSFVYSIKAQDLPSIFRTRHHLFLREIRNLLVLRTKPTTLHIKVNTGQVASPITLRDRVSDSLLGPRILLELVTSIALTHFVVIVSPYISNVQTRIERPHLEPTE